MRSFLSPTTQRPSLLRADRRFLLAAVLLGAVVLTLRILLTKALTFCGTPDACFYLGTAQTLAAGHGFHSNVLYDFQQAHPTLPNTGLEYWRPGVSFALLLLKPFGAITLGKSIALTATVGLIYAAAAWHTAVQVWPGRGKAFAAFALCLLSTPAWVGSASPDSSLYYGAAIAWFLALLTVRRQGLLQDVLALFCVCVGYLVRNDAALLIVPLLAVLMARHATARRQPKGTKDLRGASGLYITLMLAGFLAALVPMHLLYKSVLGTAFPSGTKQALFLDSLSDFGRYNDPLSFRTLFRRGPTHLVVLRVASVATILYRIAVLMIGYPALVFLPGL